MLSKTVSTMNTKWMKLLKEGGCIKRLWMPIRAKGREDILPFDVWFTLREHILSVLKGYLHLIPIDPPLPLAEMERDEFNAYRQTLLQHYLYELAFHEADELLGIEKKMQSEVFTEQFQYLEDYSKELIEECRDSEYGRAFFDLRWYSTSKLKSRLAKRSYSSQLTTETVCSTQYKANPSLYDLNLLKQISEIKASFEPTLLRLTYALLETLKHYCKVSKQCIIKDYSPNEVLNEYCKRVVFFVKL